MTSNHEPPRGRIPELLRGRKARKASHALSYGPLSDKGFDTLQSFSLRCVVRIFKRLRMLCYSVVCRGVARNDSVQIIMHMVSCTAFCIKPFMHRQTSQPGKQQPNVRFFEVFKFYLLVL